MDCQAFTFISKIAAHAVSGQQMWNYAIFFCSTKSKKSRLEVLSVFRFLTRRRHAFVVSPVISCSPLRRPARELFRRLAVAFSSFRSRLFVVSQSPFRRLVVASSSSRSRLFVISRSSRGHLFVISPVTSSSLWYCCIL